MSKSATLQLDGKTFELPIIEGTEGEKALDITRLRQQTGYITLDSGYGNTGACLSSITFIDGDEGILRYRGIDIVELCEKSTFMEVSYLLIYGHLPTVDEFARFKDKVHHHSLIHEDMKSFFTSYPGHAHPMAILSAMVCSLSVYHPELLQPDQSHEDRDQTITRLLSKVRVLAAFAYKRSVGEAFVYTTPQLDYLSNFLHMMFTTPMNEYFPDELIRKTLDVLFIVHADHEQNCSTSTVRMVGSSKANLFASLSAGICALWGPLHGGANQAVIEMLEAIHADGGNHKKYLELAKDKNSPFRLMGFGHRVYRNYDPRAQILKSYCDKVLDHLGVRDPIFDIAKALEEAALTDPYFIEKKLYPNVDFYSGIIYRALKIPTNMFTVMFSLGRLPGWIAHWKEMIEDPGMKIARPRQIYTGETQHPYTPIEQRT
ncbi:MAG: citrate (Si)-synthase [Candidatus Methylumidiphilus alinenensis]|uniref:Citrate synthase n=1 Tax=Candidatus Methylumidiphilus alinenensis TaxID=2202197 RepID=A0A2W4TBI7_9GAMM|nr:MAG: citrate (Si)-synthase [Candidatus Methylumidiphilus alinenensis]